MCTCACTSGCGGQYLLVCVHILCGSLCKDVSVCTYVWRSVRGGQRIDCVGGQCMGTSRQYSS